MAQTLNLEEEPQPPETFYNRSLGLASSAPQLSTKMVSILAKLEDRTFLGSAK